MFIKKLVHGLLALALTMGSVPAPAQPAVMLKAGAARVDITPALADLPKPFDTIGDRIYARALVLDDGRSRAVIVVTDLPTIAADVHRELIAAIAKETGARLANVMVAVTHTHNAVRMDRNPQGIILPGSAKITAFTFERIIQAVRQAAAGLQPARIGYAEGTTQLIGREGAPAGGRASPVPVPPYPIDRTLGLLKVEAVSGQPIALIVNSGMEPIMRMPDKNIVSGDVAGAMERHIEQRYGDKVVAMYSTGSQSSGTYGTRPQPPLPDPKSAPITEAVGALLGEDALALSAKVQTSASASIAGAVQTVRCPGKITSPFNLPDRCSDAPGATLPRCDFKDKDTGPIDLMVGVLRIGDITLVSADANITQPVWQKFKATAPPKTLLVNLAFGPMRYVIDDIYYPSYSYHATATSAKPGCAAAGFIQGASSMIKQVRTTSGG